jgi:hypothetical protein
MSYEFVQLPGLTLNQSFQLQKIGYTKEHIEELVKAKIATPISFYREVMGTVR